MEDGGVLLLHHILRKEHVMTIGTIVYILAGVTFAGALAWAGMSYARAEKAPARRDDQ